MIVSWGFRIVGPARACGRRACSTAAPETFRRMRIAWRQRPRAPPERASRQDLARSSVTERQPVSETGRRYQLQKRHWASGGAASPGKPSSTRIERSQFMPTHITSACAQRKGSFGLPSCGIAQAGCVRQAMRRSEAYP
jgi:hypothetical protein